MPVENGDGTWEIRPLGEVIDLFDHKRVPLNSRERQERQGPFPYYGAQGIIDHIDDYIFDGSYILVAEDGENLNSKKLPLALFASGKFWVNNHAHILRGKPEVADDTFLLACLNNADIKPYVTGAAQPKLSQSNLRLVEVPLPPLPVQRRIAGILSAYDELMENCQRRIRILEEMARALYREWFVHFRFSGHEKVPRVDSVLGPIPKGWEVKTVAESFEISGGGTPSRKESAYWDGGTIQWFSPSDLTGADTRFMDDSSDHINERGLAESSARLFPACSVMLTSRATIGAIAINTHEACTNQGFITCLPNERSPLHFLFEWLTDNVPQFVRIASGATFKEISRGVFKTINFLQPPARLVARFESAAMPMAEQVLALQRKIQNLRRTRDLLLPRLLSGQLPLDVSRAEDEIARR
ncbi:MAG: restriction endonuclease subunit S [Chthoniobacterales bacterium]|nr:restriction endonuclease subunit S [Chthoniobacterales bacterium]